MRRPYKNVGGRLSSPVGITDEMRAAGLQGVVTLALDDAQNSNGASKLVEDESWLSQAAETVAAKMVVGPDLQMKLAKDGYRVKPMHMDTNPEYWTEYSIKTTPTFIGPDGKQVIGYQEYMPLRALLDSYK